MLRPRSVALATVAALAAATVAARAETIRVAAGETLAGALTGAHAGDTLILAPGTYRGGIVLATPNLTLVGEDGAIVDGGGQGNTITVEAPHVTLRHLGIRNSGRSLIDKNSGVFFDRTADGGVLEDCDVTDNLISVYLDGPRDVLVRGNRVTGLHLPRKSERGPAVSLWNTPGSRIEDNDIRAGRDGVFSVTSRQNVIARNRFHDLRFAVHFMYTNDSTVADNISAGNDVGYVLMYSDRLDVHGNASVHDRDHGILLNYANDSRIEGNAVRDSEKCVFIYNANKNLLRGNWFEGCRIGVHFTAGSERNTIVGNAFVGNRTQVMYVGTRALDWSANGRGNYWSDDPAFDLDGNGIADTAYRPNDVVDQIVWRAPSAKLLLNSPAVQVLHYAQAAFPAIHPGGVIDSAPLMHPAPPPAVAHLEDAP
jgi:nitrous oxidase accessory protein